MPTDRQAEVRNEIARIRDLCGDVEVEAPSGSLVFVDDFKRARTPMAGGFPVGAGTHMVRVVRDGAVLLEQRVKVRGAKTIRLKAGSVPIRMEAVAARPPQPPEEPEEPEEPEPEVESEPVDAPPEEPEPEGPPPNRKVVIGAVLAALGGATAIAGVVTGGLARSKTKDLEDRCPDKQCPDPGDETLHDDAAKLSLATDVLLPAGAAIAAAGVVLVVLGLRDESPEEPAVELTATAGPGLVGAAVGGRF